MRKTILAFMGGLALATAPAAASADAPAGKSFKVGIITYAGQPVQGGRGGPDEGGQIKRLLAERGYVEGRNVEYRFYAGNRDMAKTEAYARELVAWKPDMIVGMMSNADVALTKAVAGTDIPVVAWSTHLVATGAVKSFRQPGPNFTGFSYVPEHEISMLRVLKLVKPEMRKVAHLYNRNYVPAPYTRAELERSAAMMGLQMKVYEVTEAKNFESVFQAMQKDGMEGIAVGPHELFNTNGPTLGPLAQKYKLPMVGCCQVSLARGGGVASFSPPPGWPVMADRIDLILNGKARPADLPVVRNIRAPLTVNPKAIEQLGLKVPPGLLEEADVVLR